MTTATKAKPVTVKHLIKLAADEATVMWADGPHTVRLRRLQGGKVSKSLLAAVEAAGASLVAQELIDLGLPYVRTLERLAAEYVSDEQAFTIAAMAWLGRKVASDRIFVLPLDPEPYSAEDDEA